MFYQTESKLQGWRALAILDDNTQCLLYVGRSTTQIRTGYAAAFLEVLDNEQRARVRSISMQCWQGAADRGRWIAKAVLSIPCSKPAAAQSLVTETDLILNSLPAGWSMTWRPPADPARPFCLSGGRRRHGGALAGLPPWSFPFVSR